MEIWKLTNQKSQTGMGRDHILTTWGPGISHTVNDPGNILCQHGVIHGYASPLIAAFCNPIHGNFSNPVLWRCETPKIVANDGLNIGTHTCKTIEIFPLPKITTEQRVEIAIRIALQRYREPGFVAWAEKWLSGDDRSQAAAAAAAWAAWAARAARAATVEAIAAAEAAAAWAAAWSARAAARAAAAAEAWAAAWATRAAADSFSAGLDLLIHQVMAGYKEENRNVDNNANGNYCPATFVEARK